MIKDKMETIRAYLKWVSEVWDIIPEKKISNEQMEAEYQLFLSWERDCINLELSPKEAAKYIIDKFNEHISNE